MHEQARRRAGGVALKHIAVVGAGTMGHGIAQVGAMAGYATRITDSDPGALELAMERVRKNLKGGIERGKITPEAAARAQDRISTEVDLDRAVAEADIVIEAIVEDLDTKRDLFRRLDRATQPETILATNTSSLSIESIASAVTRPQMVVGMHFFNPVHIMKLVEIVVHPTTSETVVERVRSLAVAMGKEPIRVKDSPGFASSRLGVVLGLEAMRMVEQGVASAEDIDRAMELGYGHPMGPLKLTDLVGLDVRCAIANYLRGELGDERYAPPAILLEKVKAGELGKKTGKGFYEWPTKTPS